MLNEVEAIERCILSILAQDYPGDKIEIVVVDGFSTDGSRERVNELSQQFNNIKLYDNEKKRTPVSLNIGARNALGDVIIILGAHTRIEKSFVSNNIKYMNKMGVKCTGGTQKMSVTPICSGPSAMVWDRYLACPVLRIDFFQKIDLSTQSSTPLIIKIYLMR